MNKEHFCYKCLVKGIEKRLTEPEDRKYGLCLKHQVISDREEKEANKDWYVRYR